MVCYLGLGFCCAWWESKYSSVFADILWYGREQNLTSCSLKERNILEQNLLLMFQNVDLDLFFFFFFFFFNSFIFHFYFLKWRPSLAIVFTCFFFLFVCFFGLNLWDEEFSLLLTDVPKLIFLSWLLLSSSFNWRFQTKLFIESMGINCSYFTINI